MSGRLNCIESNHLWQSLVPQNLRLLFGSLKRLKSRGAYESPVEWWKQEGKHCVLRS
jgi:hypothetical protein